MTPGKRIAQAGHAYIGAWLQAADAHPDRARAYAALDPGSKIALIVPDLGRLDEAEVRARALGLPTARITDRGHVLPPDFDGSPVVTAIGIGPVTREEVKRVTGRFALVP